MAEQTTVEGQASVAFKLMKIIAETEPDVKPKDRNYYLKLMRECVKATQGQGSPTVTAGALKKISED